MAVVYCRSSSGALSFKSSVSIATTTLDTWLGLSERASQKEAAKNSSAHTFRRVGSVPCPGPGNRFAVASKRIR